jgi:hypothetical protein
MKNILPIITLWQAGITDKVRAFVHNLDEIRQRGKPVECVFKRFRHQAAARYTGHDEAVRMGEYNGMEGIFPVEPLCLGTRDRN